MIAAPKTRFSSNQQLERLATRVRPYIDCEELDLSSQEDIVTNYPDELYKHQAISNSVSDPAGPDKALLTPEGEQWLFRKMNFYMKMAHAIFQNINRKQPNRSDLTQMQEAIEQSEHAREQIVNANTRLVASIAHRFSNSRMEYDDLISEGNMILLNAVDKFDFSRGFRFSTYATHAIQRHFYRCLQRKQKRRQRELLTATDLLSEITPAVNMDTPLDTQVAEKIINEFQHCLEDREEIIIRERFGLNDDENSETLKVVAEKVGLSKERVRQLQARAIEKLQDLAIQMKLRIEPSF